MKDDVSVMMMLAAATGKAEMLEYLLSSYGDIIDINIQDKVHDVAFSYLLYLKALFSMEGLLCIELFLTIKDLVR